jgi:carbamate kinase
MRIVVALGGNALLERGQPLTAENQREHVRIAAERLAPIVPDNQLVITHGNGPQVGLLALQSEAYREVEAYPLDVLGAQTEGMIGYLIEQELGNLLPFQKPFATVLTMVEVFADDPAFQNPTKPIGPMYTEAEAKRVAAERGWSVAPDGKGWRRIVPSPRPKRVFEIRPIKWLLDKGCIVISTGGGGIPTMYAEDGTLQGAEVVIDKDLASALLAHELDADFLVMATDVDAVYTDWGTERQQPIRRTTPEALRECDFAVGSMGPKVEAACAFVNGPRRCAAIGALRDLDRIVLREAGTIIEPDTQEPDPQTSDESPE